MLHPTFGCATVTPTRIHTHTHTGNANANANGTVTSLRLCCLHSAPSPSPSSLPPPPHNPPPSYRSSLTLPIYILHLRPLHPTYITRLNPAPHSHYPSTHLTLAAAPQALLPLKHPSSLQACAAHCLSGLSHSLSPSSCSILHLAAPPSPPPAFTLTLTPATPTPTPTAPSPNSTLPPHLTSHISPLSKSLRLCCLHSAPSPSPSSLPPPPHNPPPSYRSSLTLPIYILHLRPLHPTYITRLNRVPHSHYPSTHLTLAAAPQALLPLKHSSSLQACAAHCLSGLSHDSPSCSILHLAAPPSPPPAFTLTLTPATPTPTPTAPSPLAQHIAFQAYPTHFLPSCSILHLAALLSPPPAFTLTLTPATPTPTAPSPLAQHIAFQAYPTQFFLFMLHPTFGCATVTPTRIHTHTHTGNANANANGTVTSLRLCCLHSAPSPSPSSLPPPPHNPPPSYRSSLTLPIYILHLRPLHPTYITRLNPAPHSHYPSTHLTLAAAPQALLPLKHSSSLQACAAHCLSGLSHSLSPSSCSILHLAAPPSPPPAFTLTLTPATPTPTPTAPSPVISDALTPGGGSPLHSGVLKPATDLSGSLWCAVFCQWGALRHPSHLTKPSNLRSHLTSPHTSPLSGPSASAAYTQRRRRRPRRCRRHLTTHHPPTADH
ncbi:hypothetical protein SprV_0301031000 [Sparganum proliferum]